jgi:nitroreductase
MDFFTAVDTRSSALRLAAPGPDREQLTRIMQAAARAPDHGRIAPWRFVVLESAGRERLGEAMIELARRKQPDLSDELAQRERDKVNRAPTIIVVAARTHKTHKVPEFEQLIAVGAAVENMFLAAHALGLGAMWKTGDAAYDQCVKHALGLHRDDHIIAFLYLGTIAAAGPVKPTSIDGMVEWLG